MFVQPSTRTSSCITGRRKCGTEGAGTSWDWNTDHGCKSGETRRCVTFCFQFMSRGCRFWEFLWQPAFVVDFLESKSREQQTLFQRILWVNDSQAAYLLLLTCASTRANFWLRSVGPEQTQEFAARHEDIVWSCLLQILGMRTTPSTPTCSPPVLSASGLRLASAVRVRVAAHWSA